MKLALLVSACQVQTACGATRPLDLCDHPQSSAPGLQLLPRSSSLHAMAHLPPAHHETSKHDSPNETKVKERQNKTVPDSNSNLAKSMTHHNQTKERTTWFLSVARIEVIALTLYHPLVPSDGGIQVPQLDEERLDLLMSRQ
jgi:hypothetical protein